MQPIQKSYFMNCQAASDHCFLVALTGNEYEVDLQAKIYSCGHNKHVLWPFPHLIVKILEKRDDLMDFIDER
jgi:hypothetical protein